MKTEMITDEPSAMPDVTEQSLRAAKDSCSLA